MSASELAPAHIRAIAPYQPGKPISELAREMGLEESSIIKLASNENPLGVSPLAQKAIQAALPDLGRYPDGNGFELKQALRRPGSFDRFGQRLERCSRSGGSRLSDAERRGDLLAARFRGVSACCTG